MLDSCPVNEDQEPHGELYPFHSPEKKWGKATGRFLELCCTDLCTWGRLAHLVMAVEEGVVARPTVRVWSPGQFCVAPSPSCLLPAHLCLYGLPVLGP